MTARPGRLHPRLLVVGAAGALLVGAVALAGCGTTVSLQNGAGSAGLAGANLGSGGAAGSTAGAVGGPASAGGGSVSPGTGSVSSGAGNPVGPAPTSAVGSPGTVPTRSAPLPERAPVTVGFVILANDAAAAASFGVSELNNGDERAEADTVVADLNRHGGLAGHRVVPLYYTYSATQAEQQGQDGIEQAACTDFTQDHHVFAAVDGFYPDDTFAACMQRFHIPSLARYAPVYTGDRIKTQSVPDNYYPAGLLLDQQAQNYAAALGAQNFFRPGQSSGILAPDLPVYHRVVSRVLLPALAAWHANVKDVEFFTESSASGEVQQIQSAELKFRTDGDTQILTLENGAGILFLMEAAQSQSYTGFRYGLSTSDDPAVLELTAPKSQLANVIGMGWAPVFDVDFAHEGLLPPQQQRCYDLLTRAGQSQSNQNTFTVAVTYCEAIWFLQAAATRGAGPLSVDSVRAGVASLGTSYQSAITLTTRVIPGEAGTAAVYRPFGYQSGCGCLVYTGPARPLQRN